eukprot:5164904-Prymnesium_polylepis.1
MRSPGAFCAACSAATGTSPTFSRLCPAISAVLLALHTSYSHLCVSAGPSRPAKPPAPGRLPTLRA